MRKEGAELGLGIELVSKGKQKIHEAILVDAFNNAVMPKEGAELGLGLELVSKGKQTIHETINTQTTKNR